LLEGAVASVKIIPKRLIEALIAWDGWSWLTSSHNTVESNWFCSSCCGLGSPDVLLVVENCRSMKNGMIVLSHTLFCQPSAQIRNGIVLLFATLSNLRDPVFVRDPLIKHDGVVTNHQKSFDGCLPGAHFLDNKEDVPHFLCHKASVGYNETKCKSKYGTGLSLCRYWGRMQLPSSICHQNFFFFVSFSCEMWAISVCLLNIQNNEGKFLAVVLCFSLVPI
jgi:hypothetical protein